MWGYVRNNHADGFKYTWTIPQCMMTLRWIALASDVMLVSRPSFFSEFTCWTATLSPHFALDIPFSGEYPGMANLAAEMAKALFQAL